MVSACRCVGLLVTVAALSGVPTGSVASAAARQTQSTACRVVRIAAGPQGTEAGGEFRLQEERAVFSRIRDTQVTVYFKWEGAPGVHHLSAMWRSPAGGSSSTNTFDYTAKDRLFGAYWTIPVSPAMPTGKWSVDATVDGLPCGSYSFEVVDADARPASAARRPLAPAELFERLQAGFASLERGAIGRPVPEHDAAFLVQPGVLATAFTAIDAADTLHATLVRGQRSEVTSVGAWNRRQDWALLPTAQEGTPLPIAANEAVTGDRCYSLEVGPAGTRVLAEGTIIGRADAASSGSRFIVSFTTGEGMVGAPIVNEFGEVIGILSGGLLPGRTTLFERLRYRFELQGTPAVPISALPLAASPTSPRMLADLRAQGITMPAVIGEDSAADAGFAREMRGANPMDRASTFTTSDKQVYVYVQWQPRQRIRGTMKLAVFNDENRLVAESKTSKVDFKPGSSAVSQWKMAVPASPGVYRVDVKVGEQTMCRRFLTVR